MLNKYLKVDEEKSMLTPLIEEYKITLIHGESGSGKTHFAIKHLNKNNIKPILLDFDDNEPDEMKELNLDVDLIDGELFLQDEENKERLSLLTDRVVIIDTWTLFSKQYEEYKEPEDVAHEVCKKLIEKYNTTIIILSHTQPFSGKEDRPEVADHIYRHIKARLYIRRTTLKSAIEYHLIIEKLRGYKGKKIELLRKEDMN